MTDAIRVRAVIERKASSLPRFVVVPGSALAVWRLAGTTPVELTIGEVEVGRRNIKRWGRNDERWCIDLPAPVCRQAGVDTGDAVTLLMRVATETLPAELSSLLSSDARARRAWEALGLSQQRMLADRVRAAKQAPTRARRAAGALLPP